MKKIYILVLILLIIGAWYYHFGIINIDTKKLSSENGLGYQEGGWKESYTWDNSLPENVKLGDKLTLYYGPLKSSCIVKKLELKGAGPGYANANDSLTY